MLVQASSLSALAGIHHAFFTREGGVSQGFYARLNGGQGSNDGADRARIVAALGPMIRQPSYEVGPEFVAQFRAADARNDRFFAPARREGHAIFDLAGHIAARVARAGIGPAEDLGVCTYTDARFF